MSDKRAPRGLPSYDGDSTNELPQADRTISIASSRTRSAEGTAEVDGADILSVGFHAEGGTQEIEPVDVVAMAGKAPLSSARAPQGVVPARTPTVPPPRSLRPPASFDMPLLPTVDADPFALPSAPPRVEARTRAPAESTVQIRMAAGIPAPGSTRKLLAAIAVCGVVGALILGVVAMRAPRSEEHTQDDLRAGPSGPVTSSPFPPVPPAIDDEPALPEAPVASVAKPSPARPKTVVKPGPGRTSSDKIGVLRVPLSVRGVLVDGTPRKVIGGALYLACGTHKIKTPAHPSQMIDVPCGRTVFL